jgi:hypothetical protein
VVPDVILGWSKETSSRRSHIIGAAEIVCGSKTPGVVRVSFSLCGTTGHGKPVPAPDTVPCVRCLDRAYALAYKEALPDMVPEG